MKLHTRRRRALGRRRGLRTNDSPRLVLRRRHRRRSAARRHDDRHLQHRPARRHRRRSARSSAGTASTSPTSRSAAQGDSAVGVVIVDETAEIPQSVLDEIRKRRKEFGEVRLVQRLAEPDAEHRAVVDRHAARRRRRRSSRRGIPATWSPSFASTTPARCSRSRCAAPARRSCPRQCHPA